MSDKWFSQARNLDDPQDVLNDRSRLKDKDRSLISEVKIESQTDNFSNSTYIKPVKGLKDSSKSTRTSIKKKKKSKKYASKNTFFANNKISIFAGVFTCLIISVIVMFCLKVIDSKNSGLLVDNSSTITPYSETLNSGSERNNTEYTVEYPDVEQYFNENSSIESIVSVNDSTTLLSECDAILLISSKGFTDFPITTEYTVDGVLIDEIEVSEYSSDKHPIYMTYYINSNNEIWVISVVEGTIIASPLSYNMVYKDKTPILLSESNEIVSYDSSTNQFYYTIPNDTTIDVRCIDNIDSDSLDQLSVEVLANG